MYSYIQYWVGSKEGAAEGVSESYIHFWLDQIKFGDFIS